MSNSRLVYSTDGGRIKPGEDDSNKSPVGDGHVRVRRETKGRGGKTVTTISGLPLEEKALKELGKQLKQRCGTGGAVKDGVIEIQGEHAELLLAELKKRGYDAKRSGG
ncbi:translation initiation factor Sui1 [Aestuariirhabdus litorea]|uniref:Translation initiation factor Sui1 n=1 Tax=Aestuariirhabdus litorea TaxID=2528527 RepID=A0A3P3VNY8_9GAMM|nr:translation initiation factor Sui1 [Aestuariirhabdus litorea]RRJ83638.1 translation initiation factor Sui1 [Aestuariirhabdus litorea]RWW96859.1 translation initiation factor Sui1 [Endozoicomonadaceae bacterium GTF-13]